MNQSQNWNLPVIAELSGSFRNGQIGLFKYKKWICLTFFFVNEYFEIFLNALKKVINCCFYTYSQMF